MSYDFALQKMCTHEIRFENAVFDREYEVVRFKVPLANQKVKLYVDEVEVPPAGLWSRAAIACMSPGPYRIKRGVNDLLYLRLGHDPPAFVQLITGSVSASDLVKDLTRKIPALSFSSENNKLVVRSRLPTNGAAFSFVDPKWTDKTQSLPTTARVLAAYGRLGIIPGRVATGKLLFPPWSVIRDTNSAIDTDKMIQLHGSISNNNPIFQVSYVTYANYCRRCKGARIEFDYNVMNGTYESIDGADLLSQEFDKFLFTRLGSHWKWPWLGSRLIDRIGGKGVAGRTTVNAMLSLDVSQAFAVYQNIKMQQDRESPFQRVSDAEYPFSVRSIDVSVNPDDPTIALVGIVLISRSSGPITLKRIIGNPNPYTIGMNLGIATTPDFMLRG
jgi:hypothetical protein